MATIVFEMNVSLDGYVDHERLHNGPALFRRWTDRVHALAGEILGRRMYETMRYWDEDRPEWEAAEHAFAAVWRATPKWVVSRTLTTVGPNATLIADDVAAAVRALKAGCEGEMSVSGPTLAAHLDAAGLVDLWGLWLNPTVLGGGRPFFAGPRPPLRFVDSEAVGDGVVRLTYRPE